MQQTETPQINLKTKKVLVVDDFFNFRLTLKNMMRSLGIMYIDDAANGEEAVRKMAVRQYDISCATTISAPVNPDSRFWKKANSGGTSIIPVFSSWSRQKTPRK